MIQRIAISALIGFGFLGCDAGKVSPNGKDDGQKQAQKIDHPALPVIRDWLNKNANDPDYQVILIDGPLKKYPQTVFVGFPCGDRDVLDEQECYELRYRDVSRQGGPILRKLFVTIRDKSVTCACERNSNGTPIF